MAASGRRTTQFSAGAYAPLRARIARGVGLVHSAHHTFNTTVAITVDFLCLVGQAVVVGNDAHIFKPVGGEMTEHLSKFMAACLTTAIYLLATLAVPAHGLAAEQSVAFPDAATIENIAAQGYVYGLPTVMHYAITYQYSVDTTSPQYKAPFNHLLNGARVFTYKDTVVITPNSDTPYSFACLDLRAEPVVISVPPVADGR